MAEVDQAVENLQNMWYLAVVNGLSLDKNTFAFLQSGKQMPYTTSSLWQLIDSIPPKALTSTLSFSALNSFYQNYGGLFAVFNDPPSDAFTRIMGDKMSVWLKYKHTLNTDDLIDQ